MNKKIEIIESYLEEAEADLKLDYEYLDSDDNRISYQEGIIRGLKIALKILKK